MKMKKLEWRIWGGNRREEDAIYIWAYSLDDALRIAKIIDPDVTVAQWTGAAAYC